MDFNRQAAIEAIKRNNDRQAEKKDVEFKSFLQKRREERERKMKEVKYELKDNKTK